MKYICLFLFLLSSVLAAEIEIPEFETKVENTTRFESDHETFLSTPPTIDPRVDPVSGSYTEDISDMVVAGAEPLTLRRFHHQAAPKIKDFGYWLFNPEHILLTNLTDKRAERFASIGRRDGSFICLQNRTKDRCTFDPGGQKEYVNFSSSGQKHPYNAKLVYSTSRRPKKGRRYWHGGKIYEGDGSIRSFSSPKFDWLSSDELSRPPYHFPVREERQPNGNIVSYLYERDEPNHPTIPRLIDIIVYNKDKTKVLNSLHFSYKADNYKDINKLTVTGSDGRKSSYTYSNIFYQLMFADSPTTPHTHYTYHRVKAKKKRRLLHKSKQLYIQSRRINRISTGEGRAFQTVYYPDEPNKVQYQKAPVGPNGEMCPIAHYTYHGNRTEMRDALDNTTTYRFNADTKRLLSIEDSMRVQSFSWDERRRTLLEKRLEDTKGNPYQITQYTYDKNYNAIEERVGDGTHWTTTHRTFSDDRFNLLLSESAQEGVETLFNYVPETNLLASKWLVVDGEISQRTFNTYDDCAVCIQTIVDDGHSEDPNDLEGVTYRKIVEIVPKQEMPCLGLPEIVIEKMLDSSGAESQLSKVIYKYAPDGQILEEAHFDANDSLRYTLYNTYDERERLISASDELGHTSFFTYDLHNNLLSCECPDKRQHRLISYDLANRPISISEQQEDGSYLTLTHEYNKLSQLVRKTDPLGNVTSYGYDVCGNVTEIVFPDGATVHKEYDPMGNCIREVNALGHVTETAYNYLGKPTHVLYPDGTEESTTYTPLGQVASFKDKNGLTTHFNYDAFGNCIQTVCQDDNGVVFKESSTTFSAFCKLSETDSMGITTTYTHDFAGRVTSQTKGKETLYFSYDPLGNITVIDNEETKTLQAFDLKGNLVSRRTYSFDRQLQTQEAFVYDASGNKIEHHSAGGIFKTNYNIFNQVISTQNPLGHTTTIDYCYETEDTVTTTDPKGIQTIISHDCCARPTLATMVNAQGEVIARTKKEYDLEDRLIQEIHGVYDGTLLIHSIAHQFEYNAVGQIKRLLEAGSKETLYEYNTRGQLSTLIKPDKTPIHHAYDACGRLTRYYADDFDYHYTYNQNDQVVEVEDVLTKATTTREYDALGHLIQETLATNLSFSSSYDAYGRRTALTLPDGSTIHFAYKGLFLTSVSYKGHTHTYSKRDLDGHLLEATLPKNLGSLSITRDPLGRYQTTESPAFSAAYTAYDSVGNLVEYSFKDSLGEQTKSFIYDDLNQLISENDHSYRFDSLNNRLQKDGLIHSVNDLCQVVSDGQSAYTYDANGNCLSDQEWSYTYDSLDHLIAMSKESLRIEYTYDSFHRRLSKTTLAAHTPPQTIYYLWDGDNEIGALDSNGNLIELRVLGEGLGAEIGAALLLFLDNTFYLPIHDHRGCLVSLINTETALAEETYRYTAFGEEQTSNTLSPWRFSSKRTDEESSLVYFGRRYYMPKLGRWITCDPIGFEDGPNLYAYTHNNPLTLLDLYGYQGFQPKGFAYPTFNIWDVIGLGIPRAFARSFVATDASSYEDSLENKSHTFDAQSLTKTKLRAFSNGAAAMVVNGAINRLETASDHFSLLAERTGYNFTCCYNATHGLIKDGGEVFMNRIGVATTPCFVLGEALDKHFENNPNSPVLLVGTSQGSEIVTQTVTHYDSSKRDLIHVCLMAPVMFLDDNLCGSVQHYVVPIHRDPTQTFDIWGRIRCRKTVQVLDCHPDAPLFDHSISSPTYSKPAVKAFRDFEDIARGLR